MTANADNDRDGDGHLDEADICPTTYNPCQDPTDTDHDGVPDECDACPGDSGRVEPRGTLPDADGDGFPDACDCDPATADPSDRDRDFVSDRCDNCNNFLFFPGGGARSRVPVYNPDQADTDLDGVGDACDNCVGVANADQADADRDGIGDVCDDCKIIYDPLQPNCNADAEEVAHLDPVGDACDPEPCAATRPRATSRTHGFRMDIVTDQLWVDGFGSAALDARGSHRWCSCSAATDNTRATRGACRDPQADLSGSCIEGDPFPYRSTLPRDRGAWQMPATNPSTFLDPARPAGSLPSAVTPPGGLPDEFIIPYRINLLTWGGITRSTQLFTADTRVYWDTTADAALYGFPIPGSTAHQLRGVLWTHTAGPPDPIVGGYYNTRTPTEMDRTVPAARLTSEYWAGTIERPFMLLAPLPAQWPVLPLLVPRPGYRLAGALVGNTWLVKVKNGACSGASCNTRDFLPFADNHLFAEPLEVAPGVGIGSDLWTVNGQWVAASEPAPWLPATSVLYAAFDPAREVLTRALDVDASGMLQVVQAQPPPCDDPQLGCKTPVVQAQVADVAVSPLDAVRTDALLVLSARKNTLYYGGGVTVNGGYPGDLLAYDLRDGRAHPVALSEGVRLGRVLAATYSPTDDALYVLDEPPPELSSRGHERSRRDEHALLVRFLRIAADGAHVDVLRELPHFLGSSRFALAPAPDGTLYLVASNEAVHVVVRLVVQSDDVLALGFATGRGALAPGQARAHEGGLTVLTVDRRDRPVAVEYGARSFSAATRGWERRCF